VAPRFFIPYGPPYAASTFLGRLRRAVPWFYLESNFVAHARMNDLSAPKPEEPIPKHADPADANDQAVAVLRKVLETLYGAQPGFDNWFNALTQHIDTLRQTRPAALRALDAARRHDPQWFTHQSMIGYCAYVDRFAGDLRGLHNRIPHLESLGVRYLHLLPFSKPRAGDNDGGFAIADYDAVRDDLGTMADFEALASALRARNISVCFDFVLNHVADEHAWARAAQAGDAMAQSFFYTFDDRTLPDQYEKTVGQVFPETAPGNFTWNAGMGKWVWTTFYPYQWDLNYRNPSVFAEIAYALVRLANHGVEVFRLDSAPFLWKELGTTCLNLPETHLVLQALRAVLAWAAPAVLIKSEAIVPAAQAAAYLGAARPGEPEKCHLAYHGALMAASWVACVERDTSVLRSVILDTPQPPPHSSWVTYVRCHDDIVWSMLRPQIERLGGSYERRLSAVTQYLCGNHAESFARGVAFQTSGNPNAVHGTNGMAASLLGYELPDGHPQRTCALERLTLMHALAYSFGGMPVLYMGDEFAQTNDHSDAARAAAAIDSRWLHRPRWDGERAAQAAQAGTTAYAACQALQRLARVRAATPAFAAHANPARVIDTPESALLIFARGPRHVCVFNFSDQDRSIALSEVGGSTALRARDLWTDSALTSTHTLAPWTFAWIAFTSA
jgi:amylosucrase